MLLSWVGGKSKLAQQIISTFPPHKKYVEPFFGGGWVFFTKQPANESIINDINSDLINLYTVVRDQPQDLARLIVYTPLHEEVFNTFQRMMANGEVWKKVDPVKRALIYYYLVKTAFNSNPMNTFGLKTTWAIDGVLETMWKVNQKLKNTIILNRDYKEIFKYCDKNTLMYLDPPYAVTLEGDGSTYYENVIGMSEHEQLKLMLCDAKVKFKWVMSYDVHPIVDKLYKGVDGVYMFKTSEVFQSSINKHNRFVDSQTYDTAFKSEYLIMNFPLIESLPLFNEENNVPRAESSGGVEETSRTPEQPSGETGSDSESSPNSA